MWAERHELDSQLALCYDLGRHGLLSLGFLICKQSYASNYLRLAESIRETGTERMLFPAWLRPPPTHQTRSKASRLAAWALTQGLGLHLLVPSGAQVRINALHRAGCRNTNLKSDGNHHLNCNQNPQKLDKYGENERKRVPRNHGKWSLECKVGQIFRYFKPVQHIHAVRYSMKQDRGKASKEGVSKSTEL